MASEVPHALLSEEPPYRWVDRFSRIGIAISRIEDPFFCEGNVPLDKPTTLELLPKPKTPAHGDGAPSSSTASAKDGASIQLVMPECVYAPIPAEREAALRKKNFDRALVQETIKTVPLKEHFSKLLDEVFEPSPFGHGGNTVLDHSVRKAMQVKADRIVSTGLDLEKLDILESIRRGLAPNASRIHASLDKLNLYSEGGHFKSHRDTPRDELAFGTLVVALPSSFSGGNLVVRHRDSTHTCNWESKLKNWYYGGELEYRRFVNVPKNTLQWCAFFGHCNHKIEEVQQGHRLTLTYILRYDPADEGIAAQMREGMGADAVPPVPSAGDEQDDEEEEEEADDDETGGAEEMVYMMNVEQLKACCRAMGLKVGGNKSALVSRLLEKYATKSGKGGSATSTGKGKACLPDKGTYPTPLAAQLGTNLQRELREALDDYDFLEYGGLVGVPCMHLYEQDADLPPLDKEVLGGKFDPDKAIYAAAGAAASGSSPKSSTDKGGKGKGKAGAEDGGGAVISDKAESTRARDLRLKGADALVYTCAARLGLRPMVLRLLWSNQYGKYSLKKLPSLQTAYDWCSVRVVEDSFVCRTLGAESTIDAMACGEHGGPLQVDDRWGEPSLDTNKVSWVITPPIDGGKTPPAATVLSSILTSHSDYFGNEASEETFYAAAAIVFVVPPAESPGREALIAHASRRFGNLAAAKGRGPSPSKKMKGATKDGSSSPSSPEEPKDVGAKGRSGQDENKKGEEEEAEVAFGGLRRGVNPSREAADWAAYAKAWKKGNPDVTRSDAVGCARMYGVSTSGSTAAILNRIGRAAAKERYEYMDSMFGW
eukprot:g2953.t1